MEMLLYTLGGCVLLLVVWQWWRIIYYGRIGDQLIAATDRQEQHPTNPDRRILIIGDSLWVGVGATDPADSLAGRLIIDLPQALVVNRAESGARIADGLNQLEAAAEEYGDFDQVIIQLDANDIVNLTTPGQARRDLTLLLERAEAIAPDTAYMVCSSVGFTPIFLQPLDWFYTALTRWYLRQFRAVAESVGTLYIDLFRERHEDPFSADPDTYFAADKFHPSGAGYGVWYEKCRGELQCFAYDDEENNKTVKEVI